MLRPALCLLTLTLTLASPEASAQCTAPIQRLIDDKKYEEARTQTLATISRAPADHEAHQCLGRVSMAIQRPKEASGHFERAVGLDAKVSSHHLWLANSLGSLADSTSKIKLPFLARRIKSEFERAVALDPTSIDGRAGLIDFYSQAPGVMGGSMEKAWEQVRLIAKLSALRGHFQAAELYGLEKKTADAERELIAAEKENPDSSVAAYNLGGYYQNQQKWADAFATYDRMLKQFPGEANVHFQIGRTAALSGEQLDRGEKELKLFIANPPRDALVGIRAGAHHRLGMIYEKQGKKEMARAEYQQALTIDPRSENAKRSLEGMK